ncbi:MAG: hydrogenase nickel incorporation protein HypB, partial [Deltaproteobacteria bacterium]|nr:hydrogenase nickel incorporation protein HypB [Deltaproteobacteria bacterium]
LQDLGATLKFFVIEGDQQTDNDARRIEAAGAPVTQINTGQVCHLDAGMVQRGLHSINPQQGSVLMIENVGNLVCPAMFDLGEACKVVIASVTEGEDKPVKYPFMFREAGLIVLNKTDLLPYLKFDVALFAEYANRVNPQARIIRLSAQSGEGMEDWYGWIRQQRAALSPAG